MLHIAAIIAVEGDVVSCIGDLLASRCDLAIQIIANKNTGFMTAAYALAAVTALRTRLSLAESRAPLGVVLQLAQVTNAFEDALSGGGILPTLDVADDGELDMAW